MSREDFILKRAAEKRVAILASARTRFGADGYVGASVERIATDAQVSTATLYRQFPSKLVLFEATLRDGLAAFEAALAAPDPSEPRAKIAALAHAYAALLDTTDTGGMLRAVFAAAPTEPAIADVFYTAVKATVGGAFHRAMAEAVSAGILPATPEDPALPGSRLMGLVEHPILWRRLLTNQAGDRPPAAIAEAALVGFWRSFGVPA